MVKVKICGIKCIEDAEQFLDFGADFLGFLVDRNNPSKSSFIDIKLVRDIVNALPESCAKVMVTHLKDVYEIFRIIDLAGFNHVQLQEDMSKEDIMKLRERLPKLKIFKVFYPNKEMVFEEIEKFRGCFDFIHLDSFDAEKKHFGGTGMTHDWNISKEIVKSFDFPVMLAGGLNPSNVQDAIKIVKPFAVDVNSGVNKPDGTKDYQKVKSFISNAKNRKEL